MTKTRIKPGDTIKYKLLTIAIDCRANNKKKGTDDSVNQKLTRSFNFYKEKGFFDFYKRKKSFYRIKMTRALLKPKKAAARTFGKR